MISLRMKSIIKATMGVVAILLCVISIYEVNLLVQDIYGGTGELSAKYELENVEYSFDGKQFNEIDAFHNTDKYDKKQNMIIKGTLNIEHLKNPVLFIKVRNNYYDIYVDGDRFLLKEKENILNNFSAIDFKTLPKDANGKTIEIFLYSVNPNEIANGLEVYTANRFQVVTGLIYKGIGSLLFSVFTIVAGVILLSLSLSERYRKYGLNIIGYFSVLMGIVWLFSFNELAILFVNKLYLVSFITSIAMYQVPIAILLFTQKYEKNQVNKARFRSAINVYLVFLLGVLILELLNIVNVKEFGFFIAIAIAVINMVSLSVFLKQINIGDIKKLKVYNKLAEDNGDDYSIFEQYIPFVFSLFLIINLIGSLMYVVTANQIYYSVSIGISTTILLIFCGVLFSHDLRKINNIAVTDQERRLLNRNRINILVEEQANLFNEASIEKISDKFSNNIKGILFPYENIEKNGYRLSSNEVRKQYIADYKTFLNESSSIIYVMMPDEENLSVVHHKVVSGTGIYEKYIGKDPQKAMDRDEFGKLLFIMKGVKEPDPQDMAIIIGSEVDPKGIILFKNTGNMEGLLKGLLESYVRTCAILIENLKLISEARNIQFETVYNLNEISELRSKETGYHIKRVALYSILLGKKLGMTEEEIEVLQLAASMHDIGKINIPDKILNKPGKLTDEEFTVMKSHTEIGYDILKNTNNNVMKVGAIVAKYHHEKYNGKGYYGLKGEEIPKVARIVAVADVFDALSVNRVYKDAWPLEKIMDLFKKERGEHFDSDLVDILFEYLGEFLEIRDRYKEEHE